MWLPAGYVKFDMRFLLFLFCSSFWQLALRLAKSSALRTGKLMTLHFAS